jgi:hypothetical protein
VSVLLGPPLTPKKVGSSKIRLLMNYKHTLSQKQKISNFFIFYFSSLSQIVLLQDQIATATAATTT